MSRRFVTLDVFTDRALAGNPLAIVLDAEGLSTEDMAKIAREFNLSETVFLLPADHPAHSARVRIFTPNRELPFAGHPTVGTAIHLAETRLGAQNGKQDMIVMLEEAVGPVRAAVSLEAGKPGFAEFDLPKLPTPWGEPVNRELMASALGLTSLEIGFENHVLSRFEAGVPFTFIPVRDSSVLARAEVQQVHWQNALSDAHSGAFLYCRHPSGKAHHIQARMFDPGAGIAEDPATGAAVAALAGAIQTFDQPISGEHRYIVEQGVEMGRPSRIFLEMTVNGGTIQGARIGGSAVVVSEGTLTL